MYVRCSKMLMIGRKYVYVLCHGRLLPYFKIKMAPVDPFTAYSVVAGLILFIIIIVSIVNKFTSSKTDKHEAPQRIPAVVPRAAEGPPGLRRRAPRRRMRLSRDDESDEEGEGDSDVEEELNQLHQTEGKIGAKKMRKLQEKAERRAMREQIEQERAERKKREQEAEERRKKEEGQQRQEEAVRAEEERKRKEEQERREHEEYLKLKEMFSVDEEGQQETEADLDSHSLLQEFINYIKQSKVVMLEDLAAHFKLNTQDVIQRVQDLQTSGELTGVIDDRGKFIYITMEELEAVAKFVRQNGRVSIAELAESSNRLITLDSDLCKLQSSNALLMADTAAA